MLFPKTLKPHLLYKLLHPPKPSILTQLPPHLVSHPLEPVKWAPPLSQRTFSTKLQFVSDLDEKPKKGETPPELLSSETTGMGSEVKSTRQKKVKTPLDGTEGGSESGEMKSKKEKKGKKALGLSQTVEGESESGGLKIKKQKKGEKTLEVSSREAVGLSETVEGESEVEELDADNKLKNSDSDDKGSNSTMQVRSKKVKGKKLVDVPVKKALAFGESGTEESEEESGFSEKLSKQKEGKKPLDDLFKEAVGLSEKVEGESEMEELDDEEGGLSKKMRDINELKKKLWKIESEVRSMKGESEFKKAKKKMMKKRESVSVEAPKRVSLYSLFASNPKNPQSDSLQTEKSVSKEKPVVTEQVDGEESVELKPMEELSPETIMLVTHLHEKGYLKNANFLRSHLLDLSCFSTPYSRGYLRSAAERFGRDHQEKVKSLSEVDLKRIVLFGCPSTEKKTVFAVKRVRSYFDIQEDMVCRPCELNSSCDSKYHTVGKKADNLDIADVMKILTLYALEMVPPRRVIPDEVKDSIARLLKQVVNF